MQANQPQRKDSFTSYQRAAMAHFDYYRAGQVFFDPDNRWVSRADIRDDAELARRYVEWRKVVADGRGL